MQKGFQIVEDPTNMKSGYAGEQPCKTDLMVCCHFRDALEDDLRRLYLVEVFIIPDHVPQKIEIYKGCIILQ